MGLGVVGMALVAGRRGPLDERQQPLGRPVERGHGEPAVRHGARERRVVLLAEPGHLEVEARRERRDPVVDRAPVGHDDPVEAPLVAQDLREQLVVLAAERAVDAVVGAHHRPRRAGRDRALPAREVELAQGALVDQRVDAVAAVLLVVGREVLERGGDALRLHAADPRAGHLAGQQRVLGEVLEVAAAERRALEVRARSEQHADALGAGLAPQRGADLLEQRHVPGRRERRARREAGGRAAAAQPRVVERLLAADAVRAVGEHDRRHAEPLDAAHRPERVADAERRLLRERELRDEAGHASLHTRSRRSVSQARR